MGELHLFPSPAAAGSFPVPFGDVLEAWSGPFPWGEDSWKWVRERTWVRWASDAPRHREALSESESAAERAAAADRCVVWIGPHLQEQLLLVWLATTLRRAGVPPGHVVVREVVADDVLSLGELEPGEQEALASPAQSLDGAQVDLLERVFQALADATPARLGELLTAEADWGPRGQLKQQLGLVPWLYPDESDGLDEVGRTLLGSVGIEGPSVARILASAMVRTFEAGAAAVCPYGDEAFVAQLVQLSQGPEPLIELEGEPWSDVSAARARLTDAGRSVSAGERSALDCLGDRWVFGVHIDPTAEAVWCRRDEALVHLPR